MLEEGLDPCKLELQIVVRLPMGTGNQTQVPSYSSKCSSPLTHLSKQAMTCIFDSLYKILFPVRDLRTACLITTSNMFAVCEGRRTVH